MNFLFPFYRELPLFYGICCVSESSLNWILNKKGTGNAAIIVIGGAQEALDAHPGGDYRLTLAHRKGFARVALQNGYAQYLMEFQDVISYENHAFDEKKGSL